MPRPSGRNLDHFKDVYCRYRRFRPESGPGETSFKVSGAAEMAKQSTNREPQYCCQMFSVFSLFKGPRVPFQRQLSRCTPQQPHCPSAKGGADPGLPRRHPGIFDSTDFPGDGAANSISKGGERQHLGLKPCYAKPKWTVPVRSSQTGHGGL